MINENRERLTLEENMKLVREIFFSKQTSELRLVDLKSIEVSNRNGDEDEEKNDVRGEEILITKPESKIKAYIIPTNEELVIARDTKALVKNM